MDVFVARQPILNKKKQLVGYEMLYRDGPENVFPKNVKGSQATLNVLNNTHLNEGLSAFTQDKIALINFTQDCLLDGLPTMLPPDNVVVEILECVEPNDQVFSACQDLARKGYRLALDDFVYDDAWSRFLPLVKLIKIDIEQTSFAELQALVMRVRQHENANVRRIRFLVERVETEAQFNEAIKLGVDFFQGYYFARPTVVKSKDVPPQQALLMAIYSESMRNELDIDKLERLFKQDPGITFKLLTYLNSGNFNLSKEISSIKTALVYLGDEKLRRFISMMVTAGFKGGKPGHLIEKALFRARFCELIAEQAQPCLVQNAFFAGLLSMLELLLDRPIKDVLSNITVAPEITEALTFREDEIELEGGKRLRDILNLVMIHETGKWRSLKARCARLNLDEQMVPDLHAGALQWVDDFVEQAKTNTHSDASMF